ncbi:MAG: tetratricopeptide repeat protein [Lachnospiraceae bacterium]|nr:tetratricopeptide repeat protein [Lachnospiraceae bacterium]
MQKKQIIKILMTAALCMGLTGCIGKSSGGTLTQQGMEAIESGDYAAAGENFNQALAGGEDAVLAYRGLGLSLMGQANYEQALEAFEQALSYTDEKMPDTVEDIQLYKASAQFRLKDYEGTIDTCSTILENDDQMVDAYYLRGAGFLCQGSQDKAKVDFDQAAALTPKDYELYLNIYEVYQTQNLSGVGDEYLQTALNIAPSGVEDYYSIGRIYFYLGQYDEAQTALLSPVDQEYQPALYLMSRIYLEQEDYAHAKAMYETIQQKNGDSAEVYNGLALCSIAAGEYDEALTYISQGLALNENAGRQELLFNEIVAYEKKLDFGTAKVKAQAYVEAYPTDEAGQKEMDFLSSR